MRSDLTDIHRIRNRETADLSESYSGHRTRVMQLISATVTDLSGSPSGTCASIALLGAGNCLDIDLQETAKLFDTLHLVDLDESALQTAVKASPIPAERFQLHAPVDIAEPLLSLTRHDFEPTEGGPGQPVELLQQLASENGVSEVPEADVVVSLCVYSQILDALQQVMAEDHPYFPHALKSVRIGHLRRMLNMLRPGGVAIFVTDIVSSDTAPELRSADQRDLPELVKQLISDRNFFSGTNPAMVLNDLNMLSRLPGGADTVHTLDPWLWQMGERIYAVYAMRIQKKMPVQEAPPEDDG